MEPNFKQVQIPPQGHQLRRIWEPSIIKAHFATWRLISWIYKKYKTIESYRHIYSPDPNRYEVADRACLRMYTYLTPSSIDLSESFENLFELDCTTPYELSESQCLIWYIILLFFLTPFNIRRKSLGNSQDCRLGFSLSQLIPCQKNCKKWGSHIELTGLYITWENTSE